MYEKTIESYIRQGFSDIATDGLLIQFLFNNMEEEERQRANKWIQENVSKIDVFQGYRRSAPAGPLVSIVPSGENETEPPVSGLAAEYVDEFNRRIREEGTWFEVSYRCMAISANADACSYLASAIRFTLLRYRPQLTALGLIEQNLSLTDLVPAEEYSDPNVEAFQRGIQLTGKSFVSYPVLVGDPVSTVAVTGAVVGSTSASIPSASFAAPIVDTFARADDTALGRADTGQPWVALSGTWGIVDGYGALLTPGVDHRSLAVQSLTANGIITMTSDFPVGARIAFRFTDKNNGFYVEADSGSWLLKKVASGSLTTIGTYAVTPEDGDEVKVSFADASISVFINGRIAIHVGQAFNQSAVLHGIGATDSSVARFTRFTA